MSALFSRKPSSTEWIAPVLVLATLVFVGSAVPAGAQDAMTAESAAVVKEAYLADLEVMREKFLGLAEAIGSVAIA